ncbi:hypothetical protein ACFWY9_04655 [Amycolatopsis sp. NPDC059027]|uniref:hypothetical protein n=1 Tax=Amycolatopsis sp. NPDC059027 TaxID=3346709 RepID=UPI00366F285A
MTTTLAPPARMPIPHARLVACYAAILGTFPYLTLKIAWVTGGTLGLRDPSFVDSPTMVFANLLTAGMDAVAIALAFALTYAWGRRIPAPLVLFPAWAATGLLAPIVLSSPVIGVDLLSSSTSTLPLHDWVWAVVYGGFTWQGLALLTAFVFYVRDRWPVLTTTRTRPVGVLGRIAGVAAIGTAALHFAWAAGSTFALVPGRTAGLSSRFLDIVVGVLTLLAVAALLTLHRGRLWPRLVVVWTGAGSMVGWGSWMLFTTVLGGPLAEGATLVQAAVYAVQVTVGVLAMVAVLRRIPRTA